MLKIWDQKEKEQYVALKQEGSDINLHIVDEKGIHIPGGNILALVKCDKNDNYQLYLCEGILAKFGINLDCHGRIKLRS